MAKFLISGCYTQEGLRGLQKDTASGRKQAVSTALDGLGGKLESIHYALGEYDVYVIADMPGHVQAAAIGIAVSVTGLVRTRTTALLTVEEADQALQQAVKYRPPGG